MEAVFWLWSSILFLFGRAGSYWAAVSRVGAAGSRWTCKNNRKIVKGKGKGTGGVGSGLELGV
ncbi:hypothetical protein KY290_033641 [Solanum tuberosum]|uniref:Uncharacterized protein n=2 Tax=Solanum tuberosum TaxID=4113 RepID=A0ABQ7U2P2_SOLTU|nr:hypothetical protein KY289_033009 [Solanum tuberosum]KAH0644733.1 hypothetical protein KY284_032617 [Solanum tuberosum]KAH0647650.1 hypothetical protein KY285_032898 [Solanum tuberosum]KAH0740598.1 hypothetical protein KY290_033641 [Solanum tuberosum]